ncbi:beta-ketoacyl synthase N-terminal-like domain-containing protein [Sorangium sp. So ce136]|uniref:beta-ketoacyl synthase N-terminal-like domain-containing protein n=1 Tax=Sorangium sp. So ce136 TaxID=3133284 RepID=UPI003F0CD287
MNQVFETALSIDNPIIRDHVVHGQRILPGLAYIDLLYQLAQQALGIDFASYALRRIAIFRPLAVRADRPVRLRIAFAEQPDGWSVTVDGCEAEEVERKVYITAELRAHSATFAQTLSIRSIRDQASRRRDLESVYAECRERGLVHQGMIKAQGDVYLTDLGMLSELRVDDRYREEAKAYLFHPTLIDGAAVSTYALERVVDAGELFIPLFYEEFYAVEPLQTSCFASVDVSSVRKTNDIATLDIAFYNQSGKRVALLKGFTSKKVREAGALSLASSKVHSNAAAAGEAVPGSSGDLEASVRAVFARQLNGTPEEISLDTVFFEMGLQSAQLLQVVEEIEALFDLSLSPTLLFETNSVRELIAYLAPKVSAGSKVSAASGPAPLSSGDLEARVRAVFARQLNGNPEDVSLDTVFFEMGLQSAQLLRVVEEIEALFGLSLSPTLLFETNSVRELIAYLAPKVKTGTRAATPGSYAFYGHEPYLQDHRVFGRPALMGVTHPSLALDAYLADHPYPVELRRIEFVGGPITLEATETAQISVHFREEQGTTHFNTDHYVNDPGDRKVCCRGTVTGSATPAADTLHLAAMLQRAKPLDHQTIDEWYELIPGFQLGQMLRTIKAAYLVDESTLLMRVDLKGKLQKGSVARFAFDPLLFNACYMVFQHIDPSRRSNIFVPLLVERLTVYRPMTESAYVVNTVRAVKGGFVSFDAVVLTEQGERIAEVHNASVREVSDPSLLANASFGDKKPHGDATEPRAESTGALDIAIVGMAGRYPGSYDVGAFWDNLREGRDCITEIPKERWSWEDYYAENRAQPGSVYSKWGGFIEDHDRFDPVFFNIAPRDAELMDPQERLFLEHSWMALEDAGYTREALQSPRRRGLPVRVGVYAGVMSQEYPLFAAEASLQGQRIGLPTGISGIAARVSYFFNFNGPSMAVDTMCSSSLTSVYLACQALKEGKIDAALAGGVNVSLHPNKYLMLSQAQFISSKGRCESFGVGGDGYIPGEGVGVLLLKRLADAVSDGDHIYGVIKGAAINHGGKASGFTVPSPRAQSLVVSQAIEESGVDARTISYIEAHGTGTQLGDPIEVSGLVEAFGRGLGEKKYCRIGSAKSNIGHCEAAAGVAGVTKVLLQLKHGQLAPSLHSGELNPNIDFGATPFVVNQELCRWERPRVDGKEHPRRAGISSFGAGGANAHVIVEEYAPSVAERPRVAGGPVAIVLSARDGERLKEHARGLLKAVRGQGWTDAELADIAYTLQVGREEMEERLAFTASTVAELAEKLRQFVEGGGAGLFRGQVKRGVDVGPAPARGELRELLRRWVQGQRYDWSHLYGAERPRRISLPTYPFARERYWLPVAGAKGGVAVAAAIHPLVHRNTSGLKGLRFSSTFTGQEPLLAEQAGSGARVVPGAAYLEMARKAVAHAAGVEDGAPLRLEHVEWGEPLVVGGGETTVHVGLAEGEHGRIEFDIYTDAQGDEGEAAVHCQGSAVVLAAEPVRRIELAAVRASCHGAREVEVGALRSLQEGDGVALARVALAGHAATLGDIVLHPGLLEAVFDAAAGLRASVAAAAVEELTIHGRCTAEMWAVVRRADGRVDVDLCDADGNVVVAVKRLSFEERKAEETGLVRPAVGSVEPFQAVKRQAAAAGQLREKSTTYFKKLIGATLKLPFQKIDASVPLDEYGMESVLIAQLNQNLGQAFGEISSTVFFECQTIDALVEYFMKRHRDALAQVVGAVERAETPIHAPSEVPQPAGPRAATGPALRKRQRRSRIQTAVSDDRPARAREPIAIIGMSGRYPHARDLHEYWENLKAGKDSVTEIPEDRWSADELFHPDMAEAVELRKSYCKWGGFVEGFAEFDPLFFNISPTDALSMDPQERLFIRACWEVFEDAGYTREQLRAKFGGRVGVFVGMTRTGFSLWGPDLWEQGEVVHPRTSFASAANRVSYLLDLKGPSLPVDTGCSSSLTAIHMACEHIHRGDCEMAAVGGVNLYLHPSTYIELSAMQMLSTDGRCKSFGSGGNGFVPGEGVGVILLKPLSKALADGDHIYAVVRGTGINHGGKTNGYTVPNPVAQGRLIRQTLDRAGLSARAVSYIEAHGTGTKLGDPIEIAGLQRAFEPDTPDTGFCAIGSVKSNIGHAEAAAGIAGVTKVVLQLQHRQLVPSLHARPLNPNINFSKTAFVVQQELSEWPRPVLEIDGERREVPRIAGVSSFGAGGANAHVILEEHAPAPRSPRRAVTETHPAVVVLSARDRERLSEYAQSLVAAIRQRPLTDADLADVAYTLQVGREAMEERLALTVTSVQELEEKLTRFISGRSDIEGLHLGRIKRDSNLLGVLAVDEDMALTIDAWIAKGKLAKVLELWVRGLAVDWNRLYGEEKPKRLSLPTYPFARELYWFPTLTKKKQAEEARARAAVVHPLLRRETSELSKQRSEAIVTGQGRYVDGADDHLVNGSGSARSANGRCDFPLAGDQGPHQGSSGRVKE